MHSDTKSLGFWVYLMTDLVIFTVLFAAFIVLRHNTFGGPAAHDLFNLPQVLTQTLILLTSTFTCALVSISAEKRKIKWVILFYAITFILGFSFLMVELKEFREVIDKGVTWRHSAFLSSYFTLVGTHGFHIMIGLLWILITMITLCFRGILDSDISRISRLALYWHFLDIVWIYIFTVVYMIGIL